VAVFWKKIVRATTSKRGNQRRDEVFLVDQYAALEDAFQHHHRVLGHTDVDLVDVAAENRLPHAVENIGDADGRHEQGRTLLVDQVAQHQTLDQPGHRKHHHHGHGKRQHIGHEQVVHAHPLRNPLREPRHGKCGKQHHRALGEIEDTRGLVDQHEAQRNQRVKHATHQAAEQGFQKKSHGSFLSGWRRDRR
jgi:hypothetical protein